MVVWIIGKSGVGKSYFAKKILNKLKIKKKKIFWIDGDKFRKKYSKDLGYTKQYSSVPGNFKDDIFPDVKRRSLVQHARDKEFLSIIKGGDKFLSYWYLNKHCR